MRLTMSIKDFLSLSKNKRMLVTLFANELSPEFSSNTADRGLRSQFERNTFRTLTMQGLLSLDEHLSQDICLSSSETDVT